MNSYYGPQNTQYAYAPAPQPVYLQAPIAPANSGSGMKMVAGAVALLAVGIGAFAVVVGMKGSGAETTAQSTPSTVFNIPSEINIPSLTDDEPSTAPVVVNNPAPRVVTIPGQPAKQAPASQQAPAQQQAPAAQPAPAPQQPPAAQPAPAPQQVPAAQPAPAPVVNGEPNKGGETATPVETQADKNAKAAEGYRQQAELKRNQATGLQNSGNPLLQAQADAATREAVALDQAASALEGEQP